MAADITIILKYFPSINAKQQEQFEKLQHLYEDWNSQINVISRKDIEQLYERHVLHSLGIAKVIAFKPHSKILDIGTGGGFPGIPLAILFPECQFHLVDSIGKKIRVVRAVSEAIGLENIFVEHCRAEDVNDKFDFAVSRAVTNLPEFMGWLKGKFLKTNFNELPNGLLSLKGGDLSEELAPIKQQVKIFELSNFFSEEFFETKKVVHVKI
ncbi:MAG: 16S rRNA (guanine(527)-N(7))-methyltransferase RsmG [Bacteroidetes bacterium]|nr:16S rRNA (guanine(527)-N(7))-methyltransferase RsmG [Bacteroidota bacterium]